MDIAKYIGLFFLRTEYVYLPGIGNLEIKKSPSAYSSELGQISPPTADVVFSSTIGVIDDSFANFVANNERISLAAAANAISEFSRFVKKEIHESRTVEIPGIGNFYNKAGVIDFKTNDNFEYKPKAIPNFKNATKEYSRKEESIQEIYENTEFKTPNAQEYIELEKPKINYGKLIMLIILAVLVLGGLGYLIYYLSQPDNTVKTATNTENAINAENSVNTNSIIDSMQNDSSNVATPTQSGNEYHIISNEYKTLAQAEARSNRLNSINYNTEVRTKDSSIFYVVVKIPSTQAQEVAVDSIKKLLNPRYDVRIYQ